MLLAGMPATPDRRCRYVYLKDYRLIITPKRTEMWWRHDRETLSRFLKEEFTVRWWNPHTRDQSTHKGPVIRKFDVFFVGSLNKLFVAQTVQMWVIWDSMTSMNIRVLSGLNELLGITVNWTHLCPALYLYNVNINGMRGISMHAVMGWHSEHMTLVH